MTPESAHDIVPCGMTRTSQKSPDLLKRYCLAGVLVLMLEGQIGWAQSSAFTYQGRLIDRGQPAVGTYDFSFRLRDAATNGNSLGLPLTRVSVPVTNGLFTSLLDFGDDALAAQPLWLEIGVRTNGSVSAYTVLAPAQNLTAAPYAAFARHALAAGTATNFAPGVLLAGNGAGITNLSGASIVPGTVSSNQVDLARTPRIAAPVP